MRTRKELPFFPAFFGCWNLCLYGCKHWARLTWVFARLSCGFFCWKACEIRYVCASLAVLPRHRVGRGYEGKSLRHAFFSNFFEINGRGICDFVGNVLFSPFSERQTPSRLGGYKILPIGCISDADRLCFRHYTNTDFLTQNTPCINDQWDRILGSWRSRWRTFGVSLSVGTTRVMCAQKNHSANIFHFWSFFRFFFDFPYFSIFVENALFQRPCSIRMEMFCVWIRDTYAARKWSTRSRYGVDRLGKPTRLCSEQMGIA